MAHILALVCNNEDSLISIRQSFCYVIEATSEVTCPSNCPNTTWLVVIEQRTVCIDALYKIIVS